ncbi:MAG: hypothetical protein A3K19_20120 [Lentisphaerae bacterium RIFOXYB12_FULL_65_16]|nr:MAG: hypothetical protein A3K18_11200 [Lentisphaerae bacterium RIFOXYA12_64_32]OGV91769.1 MAG: hypothetical protein A3K19_20120 [Lentisphaerae bacterium RIFOXYB12_FULL_65_16]
MTSRERIEAAFSHREPDRTPVFEYVLLSPIADRLLGHRYAGDPANWADLVREAGWDKAVRQNAVDRLDLACLLGHDMMYVTPNPMPPAPTPAKPSPPAAHGPEDDDPVETVRRRNTARAASAGKRPADGIFAVYVALKEEMAKRGVDLPILAPAYAHGVWTDVALMQTMLLDEAVAAEHFQLATAGSLAMVERYLELGIDLMGVGGDFAGNRPLISPELYRQFIVPEVRRVSRRAHAAGARAVNASDGNLWSVIDDFLFGCEVDGYLEIDQHATMDLGRLKAAYGERVTFLGNLDCGNTLTFGTPDVVRQHVRACLDAGRGRGGHILCASNAITASVPLANYGAVVEAYREYFGLPALRLP